MVACGKSKRISQEAEENGSLRGDESNLGLLRASRIHFQGHIAHDSKARVTYAHALSLAR